MTSAILGLLACAGPTAPSTVSGATSTSAATAASTSTYPATATQVASVLAMTNAERRKAGVPELQESPKLTTAAQLQSDQMGSASQMDHVLPGAPYPSPSDRLAAVAYAWAAYGENVAMGQRSEAEVVSAWMNSASHRANILNPAYTEFGFGVAKDANGRPYYAEMFGRPR